MAQGKAPASQRVAHDLLLGQNDATLGRGRIQRDDKHHHVTGRKQVAHEPPLLHCTSGQGGKRALQVAQPLPRQRRHAHAGGPCGSAIVFGGGRGVVVSAFREGLAIRSVRPRARRRQRRLRSAGSPAFRKQIGLILRNHIGNAARLEGGEEFLVERGEAACGIYHEHSHVGLVQGGLGPLDAQVAYVAGVVDTWSVNNEHGTGRRQFHGFAHRVGGGAGHIGHYGDGLVRQRVHQAGLAGVAHAEKDDVGALAGRGIVQRHADSS